MKKIFSLRFDDMIEQFLINHKTFLTLNFDNSGLIQVICSVLKLNLVASKNFIFD